MVSVRAATTAPNHFEAVRLLMGGSSDPWVLELTT